jgi:surfactin synthase thioesterase subunit
MTTTHFNAWVTCPAPAPDARVRLFCLPFAGGGASLYRAWSKALAPHIEVCPIQLPGRENRFKETAHRDVNTLAPAIANQLQFYLDKPYLVYGHSMGALLAFEVLRLLQQKGQALPEAAILGAHRAAHLPLKRQPMIELDDAAFIGKLVTFGGFPEEVLRSKELLQFVLPTLRADFTLCDSYRHQPSEALDCPVVMVAGTRDQEVCPQDMQPWQRHSLHPARLIELDAGHFFLKTHTDEVFQIIGQCASHCMPTP